ncbi:MAG: LptA/OstA family protein [Beijerinckiaceae bacterium]
MKGQGGEFRPAPVFVALALGCSIVLLAADVGPVSAARAASQTVKEVGKATSGKQSKEQPINIESAKLDYYDKEQKLVYTGDVVAIQGEVTLKAPLLVVFLTPKDSNSSKGPPSSASQMRRWEASGHVTLISKDQIGTGDFGIYEKAENKFYLNGNVTLTQGSYITKGDHAVYDLDTGRAVVTGHVRSMFPPKNNSEDTSKQDDDAGQKSGKTSDKLDAKPKTQ